MTTIDDAFATPLIVLRPSSFQTDIPRPRAALAIRFPGDPSIPEARLREVVLRGLLQRGWQLVAAPAGEFEPSAAAHPAVLVDVSNNHVRVESADEVLFEGPLGLNPDVSGRSWLTLARAKHEVLVLATAGPTPIITAADVDAAAHAGHLVGLPGRLRTPGGNIR